MGLTVYPPGLALPLDATDIANGTVSDAEYQYLNGVTSAIQTQFDALSGQLPLTAYLSSDVTYNNTAVLANTALSVTVETGGVYQIRLVIPSTYSGAATSLMTDFGGTATITAFMGVWRAEMADVPGTAANLRAMAPGTDFSSALFDNDSNLLMFDGTMTVTTGGTFVLRGAQRVAQAVDTVILAPASLVLTKLN